MPKLKKNPTAKENDGATVGYKAQLRQMADVEWAALACFASSRVARSPRHPRVAWRSKMYYYERNK